MGETAGGGEIFEAGRLVKSLFVTLEVAGLLVKRHDKIGQIWTDSIELQPFPWLFHRPSAFENSSHLVRLAQRIAIGSRPNDDVEALWSAASRRSLGPSFHR